MTAPGTQANQARPVIYSMWACPYAQRTRALLTLKGVEPALREIDLTRPRSPEFLALNPAGKVPVLIHDGHVISESSIINEYLEEVYPEPAAMPATPYQRSQARLLIDFCNNRFAPNMYRALMEQDPARRPRAEAAAAADWIALESMLERLDAGPDAVFGAFGMVEISFAPFFERYVLNEHYWGFDPARQPGLSRVLRWRAAMLEHPAIKATGMPAHDYIKLYEDYSYGCSNGKIPPGKSHSSFDLGIPLHTRPLPARRIAS